MFLKPIKVALLLIGLYLNFDLGAQSVIFGRVTHEGKNLKGIKVILHSNNNHQHTLTDSGGNFTFNQLNFNLYKLSLFGTLYSDTLAAYNIHSDTVIQVQFDLYRAGETFKEVVVSGNLKPVKRAESAVNIEVYTPTFFKRNPTPNLFEALQNVNGVRPQINCNVCNTGDIHINGLEGPYTMVLIDGMPIVSSLSTVYGLFGIPNSLIERIEIVKGPASTLYGSEAVGGLVNVITKKPSNSPKLTVDVMGTSWGEINNDIGIRGHIGKKTDVLTGINYFNFNQTHDKNKDGFTDVTLQNRISVFQKLRVELKNNKEFNLAGRYMYETRWGGQTNWNIKFRGGDSVYAESIFTSRIEAFGNYQLPVKRDMNLSFSLNRHHQNSAYGIHYFNATQSIIFTQLTDVRKFKRHELLSGLAFRYTYYDDNTIGTSKISGNTVVNKVQITPLPGIFMQDEWKFNKKNLLLTGIRYDRHHLHGNIFTPRIAYKKMFNLDNILRLNFGTGFRVVNLFTEDHAALTGARNVTVKNELKPEKSYNFNLNYLKKLRIKTYNLLSFDATAFYTYFNNRILADYDTDPNTIYYDNLDGYAISSGLSLNIDLALKNGIRGNIGATYLDVHTINHQIRTVPVLTEKYSAVWSLGLPLNKKMNIDYTGNLIGPMRLPLLGPDDPRKPYSPWWSIQNVQMTYTGKKGIKIYGGVKNLLNWTPSKHNAFIIARSHDPFDKKIIHDGSGNIIKTVENPYAMSFDPNYVYAPNQGIRFFLGCSYQIQ